MLDTDGDGYGDALAPPNYDPGTDCNDSNPDVCLQNQRCDASDVDEDCDGVADDADSSVDTSTYTTFYADTDADTYGDASAPLTACNLPIGHVADNTDCDDSNAAISPAAVEVCDSLDVDEDCDSVVMTLIHLSTLRPSVPSTLTQTSTRGRRSERRWRRAICRAAMSLTIQTVTTLMEPSHPQRRRCATNGTSTRTVMDSPTTAILPQRERWIMRQTTMEMAMETTARR